MKTKARKILSAAAVTTALLLPSLPASAAATYSHCSAAYRVGSTSVYLKSCMKLSSKDSYSVYMWNSGSKKVYVNSEASYFQFSKDNKSWHPAGARGSTRNGQASHTSSYFTWYSYSGGSGRASSDRYARVVWNVNLHTGSTGGAPAGSKQLYSAFKYR